MTAATAATHQHRHHKVTAFSVSSVSYFLRVQPKPSVATQLTHKVTNVWVMSRSTPPGWKKVVRSWRVSMHGSPICKREHCSALPIKNCIDALRRTVRVMSTAPRILCSDSPSSSMHKTVHVCKGRCNTHNLTYYVDAFKNQTPQAAPSAADSWRALRAHPLHLVMRVIEGCLRHAEHSRRSEGAAICTVVRIIPSLSMHMHGQLQHKHQTNPVLILFKTLMSYVVQLLRCHMHHIHCCYKHLQAAAGSRTLNAHATQSKQACIPIATPKPVPTSTNHNARLHIRFPSISWTDLQSGNPLGYNNSNLYWWLQDCLHVNRS